jgi:hypothetical protein
MYEKRLEEMQRNHVDECQEMKERHNDKVESLLQKLSDVNNRLAKKDKCIAVRNVGYSVKYYRLFLKE